MGQLRKGEPVADEQNIKRLEIIIEAPLLEKVIAEIGQSGAKGYTVLRGHSGKGERGAWQEGQISTAQHMMIVIVITDKPTTDAILARLADNLESYSGIVTVSDVDVLRPHRF